MAGSEPVEEGAWRGPRPRQRRSCPAAPRPPALPRRAALPRQQRPVPSRPPWDPHPVATRPGPTRPLSRAALNAGVPERAAERSGRLPAMPGEAGLSDSGCQRRAGRDPGAAGPAARGRGRGRPAAALPSPSPRRPRVERRVRACRLLAVRAAAEVGGESEAGRALGRRSSCEGAAACPRPAAVVGALLPAVEFTYCRYGLFHKAWEARRPDGEREPVCSLYTESPGLFPTTYILALLPEKSLWLIYSIFAPQGTVNSYFRNVPGTWA